MKKQPAPTPPPPRETPAAPSPAIYIEPVRIPQPDGSLLIRAGKVIVLNGADEIGTKEMARILKVSQRRCQAILDEGILVEGRDWRRIGTRGNYIIRRAAVLLLRGVNVDVDTERK